MTDLKTQAAGFVDRWITSQHPQSDIPGMVVAIYHKDKMLLHKAYGKANLQTGEAMRIDHVFQVASQSKMFTASCIVLLVQAGKLRLDDRATKYLPYLKQHPDARMAGVTVRQLLSHRAGLIRDGFDIDYWQMLRNFPTASELQNDVINSALITDNYSPVKYSNIGYFLLGQIIQAVSGQTYADFANEHIIKPLGLTNIYPQLSSNFLNQVPTGYTRPIMGKRLAVPKDIQTHAFTPVTGWYADAKAMCQFASEHFWGTSTWLSQDLKQQMHQSRNAHFLPSEQGSNYGLGFLLFNFGTRQVIGHGGAFLGHRTATYTDPKSKLTVAVLTNAKDTPIMQIVRNIFSVFDFYEAYGQGSVPAAWQKFACSLSDMWSDVEILALPRGIKAAYPDKWLPFATIEDLEYIGDNTLKIVKAHDLAPQHEQIKYFFKNGQVQHVNFAGITAYPRKQFYEWVKNNWPS